jgi:hypothetical protein
VPASISSSNQRREDKKKQESFPMERRRPTVDSRAAVLLIYLA